MTNWKKKVAITKKPNTFIKLSLTEAYNLWKKVGSSGLSINNLLEYFIVDLIQGNTYIDQWFESRFGSPEKTFLRYLLERDILERTVAEWEEVQIMRKDLEYAVSHKKKYYLGDKTEDIKKCLEIWLEKLNDIFTGFQLWTKEETSGTLDQEMEKVSNWAYQTLGFFNIVDMHM